MHNTGEIMQLCRLCLVKEQVNVPIFEGQGDVRQIFQKISSCLPVKINRSDKLPKNICDGCSEKLDLFYDFWNTSVNSEKQLLEWLGQTPLSAGAGTTIAAKNSTTKPTDPVQQIKVDVKQEPSDHTDNNESFQAETAMADDDETSFKEESAPPPKRARRAVTKRKPITVAPDSDDDDDDDYEPVEPLTKLEDESGNSDNDNDNDNEDDSFAAPSTSADDQPGPSGLGKDGVEAPKSNSSNSNSQSTKCEHCGRECNTLYYLNRHLISHSELRPHQCTICEKRFKKKNALNQHMLNRHSTEKPFKCDMCPKAFKQKKSREIHMRIHTRNYAITCELCGAGFHGNAAYVYHMEAKHGDGTKSYVCELCGNAYSSRTTFMSHQQYHAFVSKKTPTNCPECGKTFSYLRSMQVHYSRVHSQDDKQYICDVCGKELKSKKGLREHKEVHEGNKTKKCPYCDKAFLRGNTLTIHIRTHTGQRPYECKICGKCFTQKTPLNTHMKKMHPNEAALNCNICKMQFGTIFELASHIDSYHKANKDMAQLDDSDKSAQTLPIQMENKMIGEHHHMLN